MKHFASPELWQRLQALPPDVREVAHKNFKLLKNDPSHPSLHFKKVGSYWSARVGRSHRAVAVPVDDGYLWFWIGTHAEYDRLVG